MDNTGIMLKSFLGDLENILAKQNRTIVDKVDWLTRDVEAMAKDNDSMKNELKSVREEVNFIKDEQPITRREAGRIRRAVSRKVCELLEVPVNKRDRNIEQKIKYEKYSRKLFGVCYAEISKEGHLAKSSYLDTPKKDYLLAMRDIEAFVPSCGMIEFYRMCDEDALANRIAKEQGYEV